LVLLGELGLELAEPGRERLEPGELLPRGLRRTCASLLLLAHRNHPFRVRLMIARTALLTDAIPAATPSAYCQSGSASSGKSCGFCTSSSVSPGLRRRASSSTLSLCSASSASIAR